MCLLVVISRLDPASPLVVGANRDERLDRPAVSMTVLRASGPRILGGRDEEAGGTWLAVNEHGVVAGLTNRPSPGGVDKTKRTRGELPLLLASHRDARQAVDAFVEQVRPSEYNPAWLLVGDRTSLYSLEISGGTRPEAEELGPGVHVLENSRLGDPSVKVDHVRAALGAVERDDAEALLARMSDVLVDHTIPATPDHRHGRGKGHTMERPPENLAACVHTDSYGTRSSTLVRVSSDPASMPTVRVADGHPCSTPFSDMGHLWAPGSSVGARDGVVAESQEVSEAPAGSEAPDAST